MYDFEHINVILAQLADEDIIEPMAEPCDCDDAHPLDWAEATGLFDEIADNVYPESTVDDHGVVWYTH